MSIPNLDSWLAERTGLQERLSPETLATWQRQRLRDQAEYARTHSRFWAAFYRDVDLDQPESWPFIDQETLRRAGTDMLCLPPSRVERISTLLTSGSSGPPKRLYFSARDLEQTVDFFGCGMSTLTEPGDRVWIGMNGQSRDGLGDLLARGLRREGRQPLFFGEVADPAAGGRSLQETRPDCLVGLPGQILTLARAWPELRPRSVLLSADNVPPELRREVEALWQTRVVAHWGMRETGLGGAVECLARDGYHIRHGNLFLEIIDPISGATLPPGIRGELVISTLDREAMPLLRYRTGDMAHLVTTTCACGSRLPRLGYVEGHKG